MGVQPTVPVGTQAVPETYPAKLVTMPVVETLRTCGGVGVGEVDVTEGIDCDAAEIGGGACAGDHDGGGLAAVAEGVEMSGAGGVGGGGCGSADDGVDGVRHGYGRGGERNDGRCVDRDGDRRAGGGGCEVSAGHVACTDAVDALRKKSAEDRCAVGHWC